MSERTADALAAAFDEHRRYLTAVAYRMLGSHADAEDAVQEAWLRLDRAAADVSDLRAWLTRVVSRICLDQLRTRARRREDPLADQVDVEATTPGPTAHAEAADRVGYALMLVIDQLPPDERLAYVLHDVFGMPFPEIAEVLDRSPVAARKLASRARERLRGGDPDTPPAHTLRRRRAVVEAFLAAARGGDFEALLGVLHPDVELRIDQGPAGIRVVRGAEQVASGASRYHAGAGHHTFEVVALDGRFGILSSVDGVPTSLLLVTSEDDTIVAMEALELD